jgi:hypothetical protein
MSVSVVPEMIQQSGESGPASMEEGHRAPAESTSQQRVEERLMSGPEHFSSATGYSSPEEVAEVPPFPLI